MKTTIIVSLALLAFTGAAFAQDDESSWIDSPEALFATNPERQEWNTLRSRGEREAFKSRYWLKRDPTPGTGKNEFRDLVLGRIEVADKRFPIAKTPGSRTWQGMVFVVLGSPASVLTQRQAPNQAPPPPGAGNTGGLGGPPRTAVGMVEGNETTVTWVWDRQRTPRLLDMVNLPSLQLQMIIEPNRKRDRLQNPGLFNQLREQIAEKTIVNASLTGADPSLTAPVLAAAKPADQPVTEIPDNVRAIVESAPPSSRTEAGHVMGTAVVWQETQPLTAVWFFLSGISNPQNLTMYGIVSANNGGAETLVRKHVTPSTSFFTSTPGIVAETRLALPPGSYKGSFAVVDSTGTTLARAAAPINVPASGDRLGVPSLILSGGPSEVKSGSPAGFVAGRAPVLPRADATFRRNESLWYFFEVVNPPATNAIPMELRLRKGTQWVGAPRTIDATLEQVAENRFATAFEIPLSSFEPGDYSLYVTLNDQPAAVVRRADFRIVQ